MFVALDCRTSEVKSEVLYFLNCMPSSGVEVGSSFVILYALHIFYNYSFVPIQCLIENNKH